MENQKKHWCLYNNEEQIQLLACAYEEDQIDFASQYYSDGCWFEYDIEVGKNGTIFLINETKYKKKIRFPKEPIPRPKIGEEEYNIAWTKMKKSMKDDVDLRQTILV
jgi:hypothetical protein